ncbi:MAG: putative sulfate/molybdate transporter [Methanomicrobiaceae archaeon]|nr:putative sulfate/molybdate transporter [Methanomicrobiaceae archaeon]
MTETRSLRLHPEEIAGSVGNFGTVLPIVFGVAAVADINLGTVLLFFALWYAVIGIVYGIPIPIEPLKVVGAVVIAEGLSSGDIMAAGMLTGLIFLFLGLIKGMRYIREKIPTSVIRGIQLGLALVLVNTSLRFISQDPIFAFAAIGLIAIFFIASSRSSIPDISALIVIIAGIGFGIAGYGIPPLQLPPVPGIIIPDMQNIITALVRLVPPQFPLTLTNAILATSVLAHDLYKREIEPDRLSITIGLMNIISVPFGAFPMCHGAGGLAAHYRFGGRTAVSNIIGGGILLAFALFFAHPDTLTILPAGMFGALLVFVGIELGKHGIKTDDYLVSGSMAVVALIGGMTVAFVFGLLFAAVRRRMQFRPGSG